GPQHNTKRQVFSSWVTQTVRLRKETRHVELEWTVGPIPLPPTPPLPTPGTGTGAGAGVGIGDWGKEVVSRFTAPGVTSAGRFYTDSNGREFQERVRHDGASSSQPVASSYYPATSAVFVRDE
ncbi:unnamed protein product, partial [Discosporangium mesarthrocarpum]